MNKNIVILFICLTCLLTACAYTDYVRSQFGTVSGSAVSGGGVNRLVERGKRKPYGITKNFTGGTASDEAISGDIVSGSGIASAENVTAQMQSADYWIARTVAPDKILMSEKEIEEFNKKITDQLAPDADAGYYDLSAYGSIMTGEKLREFLKKADFSGVNAVLPTKPEYSRSVLPPAWDDYYKNRNLKAVRETNDIRFGIICSRADMRELPTDVNISDSYDMEHDILQDTALAVNEPVLVLHKSLDKKWLFVIANEYAGWVKTECVGICRDKTEWLNACEMKKFIVVTGDKVFLEPNPGNRLKEPRQFTMGTKLAIVEKSEYEKEMSDRVLYDNYAVKIPERDDEGYLTYAAAAMPLGADVTEGYMEYTRANVLRQAFKLLGNYYGWGGMNNSRDCSSMIRDIHLCFGFRLPRNSGAQAMIPAEGREVLSGLSDKEKVEKMRSAEPGTILHMPGHVVLYLGCVDRNYFVISANGGFVPAEKDGTGSGTFRTRITTVNTLNVGCASDSGKTTWLSRLETIVGMP